MTDSVRVASAGAILRLQVARPDKLNALDWPTLDGLHRALDDAERDDAVRAIVIRGAGDRAFSAGADIPSIVATMADPERALREFVLRGQRLTARIEHFAKPIVAAVNGLAYGGGCEIVEACHLAIAAESARFAKPEIALGFPPTFGGTQRLPRLVGRKRALAMLLTGRPITAAEAVGIGLVNAAVADASLEPAVDELVGSIIRYPAASIAACLTAVSRGAELPIDAALAVEASQFMRVAWRPEVRERTEAFLDRKRA